MPDIFTYTDYRTFLADYYCNHKAENPAFSYQLLSDKAAHYTPFLPTPAVPEYFSN